MDRFWPGPLTLVLEKSDKIPSVITAGLSTVGLRAPTRENQLKYLSIQRKRMG